jgi:hypothetical protein
MIEIPQQKIHRGIVNGSRLHVVWVYAENLELSNRFRSNQIPLRFSHLTNLHPFIIYKYYDTTKPIGERIIEFSRYELEQVYKRELQKLKDKMNSMPTSRFVIMKFTVPYVREEKFSYVIKTLEKWLRRDLADAPNVSLAWGKKMPSFYNEIIGGWG